MKTIDNTNGQRPNQNEEYCLTVEHNNGDRHVYYGKTKKEANRNFKLKYPYFTKNIISKEWGIEEK